jgi:putative flavoprotein involved in K+ transport
MRRSLLAPGQPALRLAVALLEQGFDTTAIERSGSLGSTWRSRYRELRLNSWRPMSKLQGKGMPRSYGRYPARDDVVEYLDRFASEHRVRIRFTPQLLRVERDRELWRLLTDTRQMRCRYVIIATGWDAVPVLPAWPGRTTFVPEPSRISWTFSLIQWQGLAGSRSWSVIAKGRLLGAQRLDAQQAVVAEGWKPDRTEAK